MFSRSFRPPEPVSPRFLPRERIGDGTVEPASSVTAEYWVAMFACITLGAVAVAFRAGERLRRDTEGLV